MIDLKLNKCEEEKGVAPQISVIVPSFNYERFLKETIESILNQTFQDFEVIVVDDGSKDSSMSILKQYQQKSSKIKLFTHPNHQNLGLPRTLELGIKQASGNWVAFLEADDAWNLNCLSKRMEAVSDKNVGFCSNKIDPIIEVGASDTWFRSYVPRVEKQLKKLQGDIGSLDLQDHILSENLIPTFSCAMVKRELLLDCDFDTPVDAWLDWYLWTQIFQKTKGVFVDISLTRWRLHNSSQNSKKSLFNFLQNYSVFRKSLAYKFASEPCKNKESKIRQLEAPIFVPLTERFCLGVREIGFVPFFKQVIKRFSRL
ncbi:MAG: glycosyltransferase family 2 protein [Parasutterella sp.]|uniref:glycosyltransferase family 2 protein n=1 Tax=Parasutterella sp. TaxID=2049037 RepID=UPI0039929CA9